MNPRILLLGKNGQVGSALSHSLPCLGELIALDRGELDLSKLDDVRRAIRSIRPDLIVNAAAYTAVDRAESEPELAEAINALAPKIIAEEAKAIAAVLVHYSTDYVFDGTKSTPYLETDAPNPLSVYGRTKLAGEHAIQQAGVQYLIFRTAWVYAQEGRNFLLTVLRLATEREELRIVQDQIGAPTSSAAIAQATASVLARVYERKDARGSFATISGIYHMTAAGETSWYGFANAILDNVRKASFAPWIAAATDERPLSVRHLIPIPTSEYPTPARRPLHSVLSNSLLNSTFEIGLPDWRTQLQSFFQTPE